MHARMLTGTLIAAVLLAGAPAIALAQSSPPAPADVPPPPPLDEASPVTLEEAGEGPEEKVLPRATGGTRVEPDMPAPITSGEPLPEKVRTPDEVEPTVTIRTEGTSIVEEYRRNGRVYMVVITPENGVRYTYLDTDGDGRLEGDPREGPVQPVYYTLYEWE